MELTLTPRMRATVVAAVVPVTSPAKVEETFVTVAVMLVSPAPLPKKAPTNLFATFVKEATPLKVLDPANVWLALSKGTFPERRASWTVPEARFAALRPVRFAPLPPKTPPGETLARMEL